jgi:hypothetical protein
MGMKMFAVVVGLALAASGATAAGAAASEPAFFHCAKVAHGEFKNKTCTEGGQAGAGKYELAEGIGRKHGFVAKGGEVQLTTAPPAEISYFCPRSQLKGEFSSPTTIGNVVMTLGAECSEEGSFRRQCSSPSHPVGGVIAIGPLSGSLGYVNKEKKQVGLDLVREGGGPLAEFTCKSTGTFQLKGSIIGLITGDVNVASKRFELLLATTIEQLEGGVPAVLSLLDVGTAQEEAIKIVTMSFRVKGEALEIKA